MTEPPDRPWDTRQTPKGTPQTAPPYPYPYSYQHRPGPYPGGYLPPPQYGYPGYPPPPVELKNGLGIASLVLAIIGLLSVWVPIVNVVSMVLGLVAVVVGFFARARVKRGVANNGGIAVAGIVLAPSPSSLAWPSLLSGRPSGRTSAAVTTSTACRKPAQTNQSSSAARISSGKTSKTS